MSLPGRPEGEYRGAKSKGGPSRRIGIFGGSFDPVHNAHVALATEALAQLALDAVRWVPVGEAWQKSRTLAPAADREAMVALAIAAEPRFSIDRTELRRKGPSFTLDTLRELHAAESDVQWHLILGQDQYATLHTWRGWRELAALCTLVIANRPGARPTADPQIAAIPHESVLLPMIDVSSTEVRTRVAAGESIADLVPEPVARYIARRHLYRS